MSSLMTILLVFCFIITTGLASAADEPVRGCVSGKTTSIRGELSEDIEITIRKDRYGIIANNTIGEDDYFQGTYALIYDIRPDLGLSLLGGWRTNSLGQDYAVLKAWKGGQMCKGARGSGKDATYFFDLSYFQLINDKAAAPGESFFDLWGEMIYPLHPNWSVGLEGFADYLLETENIILSGGVKLICHIIPDALDIYGHYGIEGTIQEGPDPSDEFVKVVFTLWF